MNQLHIWLACYGITFLLCDAKLIQTARRGLTARSPFMRELLECYFCMGFWVSLAVQLFVSPVSLDHLTSYVQETALGGFSGASFCYAFNSLLLYLEAHDRNHSDS